MTNYQVRLNAWDKILAPVRVLQAADKEHRQRIRYSSDSLAWWPGLLPGPTSPVAKPSRYPPKAAGSVRALLTGLFTLTTPLHVRLCWAGHCHDFLVCSIAKLAQVKVTLTLILSMKVTDKAEAHGQAHGANRPYQQP